MHLKIMFFYSENFGNDHFLSRYHFFRPLIPTIVSSYSWLIERFVGRVHSLTPTERWSMILTTQSLTGTRINYVVSVACILMNRTNNHYQWKHSWTHMNDFYRNYVNNQFSLCSWVIKIVGCRCKRDSLVLDDRSFVASSFDRGWL